MRSRRRARASRPPDDQIVTFEVSDGGDAHALYGWRAAPAVVAGRMVLTPRDGRIGRLVVTFEEGLTWS